MTVHSRETGRGAARAEPRLDAMRTERDRFVALSFSWADLLVELDKHRRIVFATGATTPILGLAPNKIEGLYFEDIVAPQDQILVEQLLKGARGHGRLENVFVRLKGARGITTPLSFSGHALEDFDGHYFLAFRKPTVATTASRDSESGLLDAQGFIDVTQERLRTRQPDGEHLQLTMMTVPELTALRDRLDKSARDSLMTSVGATLRANSANGDSAARVDEDKFSLIHQVGLDVAELEQKIAELARQVDPLGKGVTVQSATADVGDTVSDEDMAKGLLYTINQFRHTKGSEFTVRNLSTSLSTLAAEAMKNVDSFRQLIAKSAFDIAFQPIIKATTGQIHHYEALVRFRDDGGGSPFQKIQFAEDTGLIHEFDIAMARKVVGWLSGMPRNSDRYNVAVNVSGFSVGSDAYVQQLQQLLKQNDWARGKLMFEITESARMADLDAAGKFIRSLRKQGYQVCLDDFGAGAASFQYLSTLEVDVVKLDGSAIRNAQKSEKGTAFLSALSELCRRLGVETVAEMIDHPHSLDFVRVCGVDYVQGYLFGKPSGDLKAFNPLPQGQLFAVSGRRGVG